MRELVTLSLILALVLAAPVVPFLILGPEFEEHVSGWFDRSLPAAPFAGLVAGVLAVDVLLPVPSSFVSTLAGARLGIVPATAVSWAGMTAGAMFGFALARYGGRPLVRRLAKPGDLDRLERLAERLGPALLVVTRAVPILAEAAVLLVGATRLSWRRFFLPVALSNLGIAAVYSVVGYLARQQNALLPALVASIVVPVAATIVFRRWLPRVEPQV